MTLSDLQDEMVRAWRELQAAGGWHEIEKGRADLFAAAWELASILSQGPDMAESVSIRVLSGKTYEFRDWFAEKVRRNSPIGSATVPSIVLNGFIVEVYAPRIEIWRTPKRKVVQIDLYDSNGFLVVTIPVAGMAPDNAPIVSIEDCG